MKGLAVGIAVTIIVAAVSVAVAMGTANPVNLSPFLSAGYLSGGDVAFALDLQVGWLGLAMPLVGAVIGFGIQRFIRRTPSAPAAS